MSQIYSKATSAEPSIPTSFRTDSEEDFDFEVGDGVATPSANQLQIYGDHGIETVTNSNNTDVVHIRYKKGYEQTVGANEVTLLSIAVPTDSVMSVFILVSGLSDDDAGTGGTISSIFKNISGVASIIGNNDIVLDGDASINSAEAKLEASGANILVNVTGVAGRTIEWGANVPGLLVTPEQL